MTDEMSFHQERRGRVRPFVRREWKRAAVLVAVWTFMALLFTPQTYFSNASRHITVPGAFLENTLDFYPWIVISVIVFRIGDSFPLVRGRWLRNGLVQLGFAIPICLLHVLLIRFLFQVFGRAHELAPIYLTIAFAGAFNLFVYSAIVAVGQGIRYYREYEERERRLTQAQLQMLKGQLQPHFLFNALNAITELVYERPETADRVLTSLSELLRMSLRQELAEVRLEDDLQFVYRYAAIQRELLRERFEVQYDIEPNTLVAAVPAMLLQPLVENCVKHGLADRASGGSIQISARREDRWLLLRVGDNGVGLGSPAVTRGTGIGLANTEARLTQMFGSDHSFKAGPVPEGGYVVNMRIPFRALER
jgi:sensor histidine kinase YesM